jgi:peptide deformylase
MKIIIAPHPVLRKKAKPITKVDTKIIDLIEQLRSTLKSQSDPEGVGLAFPQVNKSLRAFAFRRVLDETDVSQIEPQVAINPEIIQHSQEKNLGTQPDQPDLEGCLSLPKLYGPVPRWTWVELKYQVLEQDQLRTKTEKFKNFSARIVQHEFDHLNGVLFTDYTLKHDLPIYLDQNGTLTELTDKTPLKVY